jgi:hypothetical protein
MNIHWDEWRGSNDGRPAMYIKRLFERWGYRIDLHKFVRADDEGCFHTHPATAVRIVLWGGYVEQVETNLGFYKWRRCRSGFVGIVRPSHCHRISKLINGRNSYSLWLRGRVTAKIEIRGVC